MWPENEKAIDLFVNIATQWRMGYAGPVGLDYNVLFHRMDRMKLSPSDFEILFQDMRIVENEALTAMNNRDK